MDVTSKNFEDTLPEVYEAIDSCDFLSIDGEFTGLRNGIDVTAYDTPAEYYAKLREGSLDFLLVQVGLCTFRLDELKKKYYYKAFNFYVFPRCINRTNNDTNFLCQASSISFLSSVGFDFNKAFKEGIPYLTNADEEALREELSTKYDDLKNCESFSKVPIPEELKETVEEACKRIEKLLAADSSENEITFDKFNSFIKKLVYQTAYERFPNKNFCLHTRWIDNNAVLVATKGKSKVEHERESYEKDLKDIEEAIGFSKVFKYLSNSKKLIVGHNLMLDLLHIVNRFFWPLPKNYWEFKEMVHHIFPRIIDTKYMCSAYPFRDFIPSSVLDHMLQKLKESPFQFPDAEADGKQYCYRIEEKKSHEAGYDAYVTGLAFIALTSYLGKKVKLKSLKIAPEMLKSYENKINIMKVMDYSYVNLKGDEPKPIRDHVFHITFPKNWKTADILQLFKTYGNVHVSYCDSSTAWVTLFDREKRSAVVSELIEANSKDLHCLRKPYTVITWETYRKQTSSTAASSLYVWRRQQSSRWQKKTNNSISETPSVSKVEKSYGEGQSTKTDVALLDTKSGDVSAGTRKRKNDQSESTEKMIESEQMSDVGDTTATSSEMASEKHSQHRKRKKHLMAGKNDATDLFTYVKGSEDNLTKTFEQPSWE